MNTQTTRPQIMGRRAELMAELFLQDLGATFIASSANTNVPYDFFVGFTTANGGLNTYAVEVKATEEPVSSRYSLQKKLIDALAQSNIPVLLLIADVKRNRLYYTWGDALAEMHKSNGGKRSLTVPVTEIDDRVKEELRVKLRSKQLASSDSLR
ncbi:MAG: hypothetical protein ACREEM_14590 [Blastocatellia bacterium]